MTTGAQGLRLGPYQLIAPLGAGGMGEVWRATDTRLDRSVAIKICRLQFNERFEREAHAVAALNHPNICTLYDVGPDYLVMDLVEGPTLAERIAAGAMPLEEALAIGRQITEALDAAHEKGIVHRDLKPANVKLTANGNVKVLDFGLAKALDSATPSADPNSSPTLTMAGTRAGMILGTAAYMSPEQARGIAADKRADIWGFGVLLYEMLAGKQMFASDTVTDTLASVLKSDPDWRALPPGTPASVHRLLRRCLERDRRKRLHDIADARLEIDEAIAAPIDSPASAQSRASRSPVRTLLPWCIAALLLVSTAWLAIGHWQAAPPEPPSFQVLLQPPDKSSFTPLQLNTGGSAVSPDGRTLVFVATHEGKRLLWVRRFDSLEARPLPRTENAHFPFWSPDNRFIGFFADTKLKKIEVAGGAPQVICVIKGLGRGATWNRAGVIVVGGNGLALERVPAAGGDPVQISVVGQGESHYWPYFLEDQNHYLYLARNTKPGKSAIRAGSLNAKPGAGEDIELVKADSNGVYAPSLGGGFEWTHAGWLLFQRDITLFAQKLDTGRFKLEGDPLRVAEGVAHIGNAMFANMSASENGVLVYGHETSQNSRLIWIGRDGRSNPIKAAPAPYFMPKIRPDGSKLAISIADPQTGNTDLWQLDLLRGTQTRFSFDAFAHSFPLWSPDGQRFIFTSNKRGASNLYIKDANGSSDGEAITELSSGRGQASYDWSRDGGTSSR